jgi:hypothetical protein
MKKELEWSKWDILIVVFGIVVAVICSLFPKTDIYIAVTSGILVVLVIEVIRVRLAVPATTERLLAEIGKLCQTLAEREENQPLFLNALSRGVVRISLDQIDTVWRELSWRLQKTYRATNYQPDMYVTNTAETVLDVQKAKMTAQKIHIKKVFIVEQEHEFKTANMRKIISQHKLDLADLRYFRMDEIMDRPKLREVKERLGSVDFAVFDDKVVLLWHLDEKRACTHGEIIFGAELAKDYISFFDLLHEEAHRDFEKWLAT